MKVTNVFAAFFTRNFVNFALFYCFCLSIVLLNQLYMGGAIDFESC